MGIALTGATGYTGGRLLSALLARGDDVSVLARPQSVTQALERSGATVVVGDLANAAALDCLVQRANAVVHVAAVYRTSGHPDSSGPTKRPPSSTDDDPNGKLP